MTSRFHLGFMRELIIFHVPPSHSPQRGVRNMQILTEKGLSSQTVRDDGALRRLSEDDPGLRDGHEGEEQRVSPRVLRLSAVQSQVSIARVGFLR